MSRKPREPSQANLFGALDGTRVPSNPDLPPEAAKLMAAANQLRIERGATFARHVFGVRIEGGKWTLGSPADHASKCCCPVGAYAAVHRVPASKFGKDSRGAYVTVRADAADHLGVPLRRLDAFIAGFDGNDSPTEDVEQARWVAAGKRAFELLVGTR